VKLISDYLNVCDHNPCTNVTDGQTDRRHTIAIPRYARRCLARG